MVHIWRVNEKSNDDNEQPCEKNSLKLNDSVTAVTFASRLIDNEKSGKCFILNLEIHFFFLFRYFLVAGLDNGSIFLYTWNEQVSWQHLTSILPP